MINKYFTVEVKPEIDANLLNAAALASDDDVIFTWTPFEVPKGSCRLLNVTARVASNDGTAQHHPFQLFFAKSRLNASSGHIEAPTTIGNFNDAVTSQKSVNQILGGIKIETIDYMCQSLVGDSIASTGNSVAANGSNVTMVLTPEGTPADKYWDGSDWVAITPGYDVLWVAGVACGAMQFASTVQTDDASELGIVAGATSFHTDTKDANLVFSVGDKIQELDNTIIGTIAEIGSATGTDVDITLEAPLENGIDDGVKIYHRTPVRLVLSFEK